MALTAWIGSPLAFFALFTVQLTAQESSIAGMPPERGIYYRSGTEWVALPSDMLMPFLHAGVKDFLNVGSRDAIAEMPGSRAAIQIRNPKPTFYVRGLAATRGLYLVQSVARQDYRELRLPVSRRFQDWAHYSGPNIQEVDLKRVSRDVFSVTPRADLKPGEYAIASAPDLNDRWIRLGFEFGVSTAR